jgi:hypothetical protein
LNAVSKWEDQGLETGGRLRNFWWRGKFLHEGKAWQGYTRQEREGRVSDEVDVYREEKLVSSVVVDFVLSLEFSSQLFEASVKHETILEPDAYDNKGQYAIAMTGNNTRESKREHLSISDRGEVQLRFL